MAGERFWKRQKKQRMKTDRKLRKKPMQFWKMRKRNVQRLKKRRTRR